MADTVVDSNVQSFLYAKDALWGPYWLTPLVGAIVFINATDDLVARKTTDGGATWGSQIVCPPVPADELAERMAAFFDKQVVGNTGTKIHCAYVESIGDTLNYAAFDINAGTWSTPVENAHPSATTTDEGNQVAIALSKSGDIFIGACVQLGGTPVAFRSTDAGASFASITGPWEGTSKDRGLGTYCDTDDDADFAIWFWDESSDQITIKVYDASADTWNESTTGALSAQENTASSQWSCDTRHSDGASLLAVWSSFGASTSDLLTAECLITATTGNTITAKTNVVTDVQSGQCALFIDQVNDDVYVAYFVGTWQTAVDVVYRVSTDAMTTWSAEMPYSEDAADDHRKISAGSMAAAGGGRFQPVFFDDDDNDLFVNLTNDIFIGLPSGTGSPILPSLTAAAVGVMQPSGAAAVSLSRLGAAGAGTVTFTGMVGNGDVVLPSLVASGVGIAGLVTISGAIQLPSLSAGGVASVATELTTTFSIPVELLASAAEAGSPDTILSIPRGEQVHRLSAYLYDWEVVLRPIKGPNDISDAFGFLAAQQITDEYIGAKVGPGPILDFIDFRYDWKIDSIGEWTATVPAVDANVEPALTREAKVIQFHFEGIGLILIGWITDHEVDGEGNIQLHGYDMSVFLSRRSSFYRHLMNAGHPGLYPGAAAMLLPATYTLVFLPFTSSPSYTRRYQNHTVADMWNDLNQIYGTHWRMLPNQMVIEIGPMGDDSGKIAAPINEEDSSIIDQGALVITNVRYAKSDDEIINCVLAQGSNNSFGVSVELRHTSLQRKFGKISFTQFISISFPGPDEDSALYLDQSNGVIPAGVSSLLGQPGSSADDTDILAIAQKITIAEEYDLAYVAHFGYRTSGLGVTFGNDPVIYGIFRLDICPDDGTGQPDTTNPIHSAYCSNFPSVPAVPSVFDHGEMRNFSELMFFPNNTDGYWRIPSGDYWFVLSLAVNPGGFGFLGTPGTFAPTRLGIGVWGQGVTPNVLYDLVDGVSTFISTAVMDGTGAWTVDGDYAGLKLVMEVSGRYNTAADRALYPYLVEGQFAQGIDDSLPTSGQRVFFIRDNTSIVDWGLRERVVSFPNAIDSREGLSDIEPASNVLYGAAVTYLNRHKDLFETLSFDVVGYFELPRPGQKIRVVFRGQAELENGKYVWLDIDDLFWVMSISTSINGDGVTHNFTVTSVPENLLDPEAIPHEILRGVNRANNYFAEVEYGTHVGIDPFPNEI